MKQLDIIAIGTVIDLLEEKYPNYIPNKELTLREFDVMRGHQETIVYLKGYIEALENANNKKKRG